MGRFTAQDGSFLLAQDGGHLLVQGAPAPAVAATWTGSFAVQSGFFFPPPSAKPLAIPVTNVAGDWLFALVAWRPGTAGAGAPSICVADDAHNWWEPVGAPSTDSGPTGVVRTALWAAPAARVGNAAAGVTTVQIAPTGPVLSMAVLIIDVFGMLPWYQVAAISTNLANAATALSVSAGAPSAPAILFSGFASDNNSVTITGPSGWTALPGASATNGVDTSVDIALDAHYQITTGATTASITAGSSVDLAGVIAGVLVSAPQPVQPNPEWPVVITEMAIGAGIQTPPAQQTWTSLAARSTGFRMQQGKSYSLGQLQAGQGTLEIDNPDGALIPPGTGSFAGLDSGTPLRRRIIWPLAPVSLGIADGTFESGVTGWQVFNGTVAQSSAQHHSGSFSALVTATTSASSTYLRPVTADYVPVIPGTYYTCDLWIAPAQAGTTFQAFIDWYDATNTFISSSPSASASPGALTWTEFKVTDRAPAGAAYARYGPTMAPTTISNAYYTDDILFGPAFNPHYVAFSGYFRRWPFTVDGQLLRGKTTAEIADAWAYGTNVLSSMAIEESQIDNPHSLWPMTDPAGSQGASNVVPNGIPLTLVTSKYGAGGSVITWGANSGSLPGMSSATTTVSGKGGGSAGMWSQKLSGTSLNTQGYGSCLVCYDGAFPGLTGGGITVDAWAQPTGYSGIQGFGVSGSTFTCVGLNGIANGTPVVFTIASGFTLPTPITAGTVYYVVAASGGTTFQVSTSVGGSAVTLTSGGSGFIATTQPWNLVIFAMRDVKGTVAGLSIRNSDGALVLPYRTASGTSGTAVVDASRDYRTGTGVGFHFCLSVAGTGWRVLVNAGGVLSTSGSFPSTLPATFREITFGGIIDAYTQTGVWTGAMAMGGVFASKSQQARVVSRYEAAVGLVADAACDRIERILEYAGLTGRRWLGQQVVIYEGDLTASGQDIGGQPAVSAVNNIAQSTLPAMLSVAPTGDIFYLAKLFTWNQSIRWTLGDSTAGGEIPFLLGQMATDYDPTRVAANVQLTQLDDQTVNIPSGVMSATTMAAVADASAEQYGGQPYQQTGYLEFDWSSPYNAGGSLTDLSNWIQAVYAKPANRIQSITVDAARYPAAWPFWGGAAPGDMVRVNVRLPTASVSPLISLTARITQVTREMKFGQDGSSATVTCALDFVPEYLALKCDDATRGLLNGTNVLPW